MDPRRLLTLAAAGLLLSGCAILHETDRPAPPLAEALAVQPNPAAPAPILPPPPLVLAMAPIPNPPERMARPRTVGRAVMARVNAPPAATGRSAIAIAIAEARAPSRSDGFVGGVQVFGYDPGRVYEVWTAPLRVTVLTLGLGETVVAKAAGDTVRWQIGETTSGTGPGQRTHVLLKPLQRGLETNLVLTTNQRVYLLQLRSGAPAAFNPAVAWDVPAAEPTAPLVAGDAEARVVDPVVVPAGPLDARYRIDAKGRPRWTPTAVFNDGIRTFITFSADLAADEAPALFVVAPDGERQMVNYRQQGGMFVVDRVFDRAELRLGLRRPQIVRIVRLSGSSS
ncbi:P-type conjugative transfer protein TrbG [Phenylobacterium sp.]|jgi:type IV secretion system protein VirB9|uniref:P-type conjugative transfer protein TrbG n=1 Tax=Phenylobacterium sp. TaxID=1871053 RepID=UPI002E33E4AB|nr:P-type conjugative transfer protein TrbG [Phenylobacterium sp.]HEX4711105.1 P-type conjugative transfer protein TrbG [Phenylobacterium sp.]